MTRTHAILLGVLTLGLAAVYALVRPSQPSPDAPAAAPRRPLACRFSAGEQLAFHVRATSSARASETAPSQHLNLEATMWWRVLEDRASAGWVMAATLTDVRLDGGAADADPARRAALEAPFLLQVGRDCRFRDFGFESSTDAEARRQLQGLLQAAELVLPPLRRAQWNARHRDSLGSFDATYTLDPSAPEDAPALTRQRDGYLQSSMPMLPPQFGGRMRVDVLSSEAYAILDAQGRWVRKLTDSEHLRVWMGEKLLSEVNATVDLERLEGLQDAPASIALIDRERYAWGAPPAGAGRSSPEVPPPPEPALAALNLDGALADFASRLGQGTQGVHDATQRLASYLSIHPEAIADLLARMRGGALPEKLHSVLFLALEKTGTLAAEKGLSSALADPGMSTLNRMRAAAALQDIPKPSERTARTLIDQARAGRGNAEEQQVANASLLALGALSHRVDSSKPEVARLAREELEARLRGAREPQELTVALDAIGNSGDESLASTLEPYTRDPSPAVRTHAARAWRRMDLGTMEPVLVGWLGQESEPRVRRSIADALDERVREEGRPASPAIIAAATARLSVEPDPQTRAALIALLGSAAATDASARLALVQHFNRETVPDLQVLIGRFVRAEELR